MRSTDEELDVVVDDVSVENNIGLAAAITLSPSANSKASSSRARISASSDNLPPKARHSYLHWVAWHE